MISKMNLGILYCDGKMVNHRSFLKVILNPIFRYFGFCIATKYDNNKLGSITFIKCEKSVNIEWDFNNHNRYDKIDKKRLFI